MDERKIRGDFKHAQTPNSHKSKQIESNFRMHSPQKRIKTNSKSSDKAKNNRKVSSSSPLSSLILKSSTPKHSKGKKTSNHRRFFSISERPTSSSNSKSSNQRKNLRKFSLDPSILLPVVSKYNFLSNTGYIPGNSAKTNQDSYFAHINFANQQDAYLFGVCDGHGFYGGEVSGFIKQRLPQIISADPDIHSNPKKAIVRSIFKCNDELGKINLDVKFSGSTLNLVLIQGRILYCANVGDSRSLLARQIYDPVNKSTALNKWMAIAISRDHKPDNPEESKRIYASGGRVQAYQDENGNPAGPARVWLKNQDLPGLAMSRSLGDAVAASVGVICEAEVVSLELQPEDKFIVLGSDGVFEFISNEEIVKLSVPYFRLGDIEGCCEAIVKESTRRWKSEEEVIDDITALCVFLDIPN